MAMDQKLDNGGDDMGRLIAETVNQLAQLILLETCGKFGLSAQHLKISPITQQIKEVTNALYTLKINFESLQPKADITLNDEAISKRLKKLKTRRTPSPTWAFFGFIKQRPVVTSSFQSSEQLWEQADIQTQQSGKFSLNVTQTGISYSGLFLVMFENDERIVLDDEARMMIEIPATPSTEQVLELKAKLRTLVFVNAGNGSKDLNAMKFDDEIKAAQNTLDKKQAVTMTITNELARRNALEKLERDFTDEIVNIVSKYKK